MEIEGVNEYDPYRGSSLENEKFDMFDRRERKILKMEEKMQTSMIHITSGKLKIREKERERVWIRLKSRHVFYFIAELVERVVLLGGSALSPWAIQRDPLTVKHRVAQQTGCPGNVEADDIAPCLRLRSLEELLAVHLDPPRFTSGFAPFVDGAVMPPPINQV